MNLEKNKDLGRSKDFKEVDYGSDRLLLGI